MRALRMPSPPRTNRTVKSHSAYRSWDTFSYKSQEFFVRGLRCIGNMLVSQCSPRDGAEERGLGPLAGGGRPTDVGCRDPATAWEPTLDVERQGSGDQMPACTQTSVSCTANGTRLYDVQAPRLRGPALGPAGTPHFPQGPIRAPPRTLDQAVAACDGTVLYLSARVQPERVTCTLGTQLPHS